tara:strand:+ start:3183 stop:4538 length:1356 start_codon:yes stop_codon:yes gene_type:complete
MRDWQINRRTFLRGTAGALSTFLGLPYLEAMTPTSLRKSGTNSTPPLRMGCVYMPNGIPSDVWLPQTSKDGSIIKMNKWMSSFEPLKNDVQYITGLGSETQGSHPGAAATWLVRPCLEGDRINHKKQAGAPSMDQIIAQKIGDQTPFPSLELISRSEGSFSKSLLRHNISWRNASTPVPRETEPRAIYDRLTGVSLQNKDSNHLDSILDTVLDDAKSLKKRVGRADQERLEEYFDSVRSVEKQMNRLAGEKHSEARKKASSYPQPPEEIPEDRWAYLRLMFDMMVLAYWTDSTRVATFMLDHEQSNRFFDFPGAKGMWHSISHWRNISGNDEEGVSWPSKEVKYEHYRNIIKLHHEQVAYFFNRLKEIKEGDGTLLDNCMILYGSPFNDGNEHVSVNLPMLIAGKASGKISPGRVLKNIEGPSEGVYLTMMDMMGVPMHEIGGIDTAIPIT